MKVYILKDKDFERLLAEIDRDPQYGEWGGSSRVLSDEEKKAHQEAHRFYNFIIHRWLDSVRGSQ